jgi:hypothetical protein
LPLFQVFEPKRSQTPRGKYGSRQGLPGSFDRGCKHGNLQRLKTSARTQGPFTRKGTQTKDQTSAAVCAAVASLGSSEMPVYSKKYGKYPRQRPR